MAKQVLKLGIQNSRSVARAGYAEERILTACMLAYKTGYDSTFMNYTNVPQWQKVVGSYSWMMSFAMAAVIKNVEPSMRATNAIRRHPSNMALAAITLDSVSGGGAILCAGADEAQNFEKFCILFVKPANKGEELMVVIHIPYESNPYNTAGYNGKLCELHSPGQAPSAHKPRISAYMAAGCKRTLVLAGNLGAGGLSNGHEPKFFEDSRDQIASAHKR